MVLVFIDYKAQFIMLQNIYISIKCCYLELSIYKKKKKTG